MRSQPPTKPNTYQTKDAAKYGTKHNWQPTFQSVTPSFFEVITAKRCEAIWPTIIKKSSIAKLFNHHRIFNKLCFTVNLFAVDGAFYKAIKTFAVISVLIAISFFVKVVQLFKGFFKTFVKSLHYYSNLCEAILADRDTDLTNERTPARTYPQNPYFILGREV